MQCGLGGGGGMYEVRTSGCAMMGAGGGAVKLGAANCGPGVTGTNVGW